MKKKLYDIIFEADTKAGKLFDICLIGFILLSVLTVMVESVPNLPEQQYVILRYIEWIVTFIFVVEYILRLWVVQQARKYAFSFFGIIDLLAILPSLLELVFIGSHIMIVLRLLRLLRIFRVLKLTRYVNEAKILFDALKASKSKIGVFLFTILILITIAGTVMYLVEGQADSGFTSIPKSIYWAIVTLTTVGYGDIAPVTAVGQTIAGVIMIMGYSIIAVPTGIVTSEITKRTLQVTTQVCPSCLQEGHEKDAKHCKYCGSELNPD